MRDLAGGARVVQALGCEERTDRLRLLLATRLWRYFCFWLVCKNSDKDEARSDPQARILWAVVGFFALHRFSRAMHKIQVSCREGW